MTHSLIRNHGRQYPLQQPKNWKPKYPRYMLELPEQVDNIGITYIGVQPRHQDTPDKGSHSALHAHFTTAAQRHAASMIDKWLSTKSGELKPELYEKLYVEAGYDLPDTEMYILYWTNCPSASAMIQQVDLEGIYQRLGAHHRNQIGLWLESFIVPKSRFETIYSGNDYQPGIAALPGAEQLGHSFTGYWGAARDRIPASADDPFPREAEILEPQFDKDTRYRAIMGQNDTSLIHIRSGQYWGACDEQESVAYEDSLEPVMRRGMSFLEDNSAETGDFGLRFCRNLSTNRLLQLQEDCKAKSMTTTVAKGLASMMKAFRSFGGALSRRQAAMHDMDEGKLGLMTSALPKRKETSSSGFFRSLEELEGWAANHETHHRIFHGAHEHSTNFGKTTFKMRTWHEVAVLKRGEISFQYINCQPRTGLLPFLDLGSCASRYSI